MPIQPVAPHQPLDRTFGRFYRQLTRRNVLMLQPADKVVRRLQPHRRHRPIIRQRRFQRRRSECLLGGMARATERARSDRAHGYRQSPYRGAHLPRLLFAAWREVALRGAILQPLDIVVIVLVGFASSYVDDIAGRFQRFDRGLIAQQGRCPSRFGGSQAASNHRSAVPISRRTPVFSMKFAAKKLRWKHR